MGQEDRDHYGAAGDGSGKTWPGRGRYAGWANPSTGGTRLLWALSHDGSPPGHRRGRCDFSIRGTLVLVFLALFIAVGLEPAVEFFTRHHMRRFSLSWSSS